MKISCVHQIYYLQEENTKTIIPNRLFTIFFDTVDQLGGGHKELKAEVFHRCSPYFTNGTIENTVNALFHLILEPRMQLVQQLKENNSINVKEFDIAYYLTVMPYQLPCQEHPFFDSSRFLQKLDPSLQLIPSPPRQHSLEVQIKRFLDRSYQNKEPFNRIALLQGFRNISQENAPNMAIILNRAITEKIKGILSRQIEANFPELQRESPVIRRNNNSEIEEFLQRLIQSKLRENSSVTPDEILEILQRPLLSPLFAEFDKNKVNLRIEQTKKFYNGQATSSIPGTTATDQ